MGGKRRQLIITGEFYNAGYKDLMFDIFPICLRGGSRIFKPSFEQVVEQIKRKKLISKLNEKNFKEHLIKKIIFLTQARLLNNGEEYIDWCAFNWDFKTLESVASPLLGHLVYTGNLGILEDFGFLLLF